MYTMYTLFLISSAEFHVNINDIPRTDSQVKVAVICVLINIKIMKSTVIFE